MANEQGASGGRSGTASGIHVLAKPIGSVCGIACDYCFYLEKRGLYPGNEQFKMPDDVLAKYIEQDVDAQPTPVVEFVWHGGEPTLLGVDFFCRVVEMQQPFRDRKEIRNALQTNALHLDDEWCAFFTENGFFVGAIKLWPHMQIVSESAAGTLVMRIQLTSLVPTQVSRSVVGTLIPCGFIAEAGSGPATGRPAGSTPYLGETGMEMQFVDGVSGTVLAECRDTEVGRKYAADLDSDAAGAAKTWATGYLNSFQAWSYAKNGFDKWSLLVAERINHLRGN